MNSFLLDMCHKHTSFALGQNCGLCSSSRFCLARTVLYLCALSVLVSLGTLNTPASAFAATWPLESSRLLPSLGFHQTYTAGQSSYAHSGIDIPGTAGASISAPVAGTVCFTGSVPSGDSVLTGGGAGQTMRSAAHDRGT